MVFFSQSLDLLHQPFSKRESKIHYFHKLESTMEKARELAKKGCPDFTVVVAKHQTKGRGRLKRQWCSNEGGLYFTIILRPKITPNLCYQYNFLSSLVLVRTLNNMFNINAMVKWPNDILVDTKKISGMLSEIKIKTDNVSFMNIGIGLNVNNKPNDIKTAISLKQLIGKEISKKEILLKFLNNLETKLHNTNFNNIGLNNIGLNNIGLNNIGLNNISFNNIIAEWKEYSIPFGKRVKVITVADVSEGIAKDIDQDGALLLEMSDGTIKKIIYGDCFWDL